MATRNLARTVVEGGRSAYSKLRRRLRNRSEWRLRFDAEGNLLAGKPQRAGIRSFADRLAPFERWLNSHVGRGWNKVYREFCERFDRRTMKGWHLNDHLLRMVGLRGFPGGGGLFHVDHRGILRGRRPRSRVRHTYHELVENLRATEWAAGRQVIVRGAVSFWTARLIEAVAPASAQGRRLTPDEALFRAPQQNLWVPVMKKLASRAVDTGDCDPSEARYFRHRKLSRPHSRPGRPHGAPGAAILPLGAAVTPGFHPQILRKSPISFHSPKRTFSPTPAATAFS